MPAEIITSFFCADYWAVYEVPSNSDPEVKYEVELGGTSYARCTCRGFSYRRDCSHIKYVWDHACLWNPQWYDGGNKTLRPIRYTDSFGPDVCPECEGPTVVVRIAV